MLFRICLLILCTQLWSGFASAQSSITFISSTNRPLPDLVNAKLEDLPNTSGVDVYKQEAQDCTQVMLAIDGAVSRGDRGVIYYGDCTFEFLAAAEQTAQNGVFVVGPAFLNRFEYPYLSREGFFFTFPSVAEADLSVEFRDQQYQLFGWCSDIQLSIGNQGDSNSPLGTCLTSPGLTDSTITVDGAVMLAEIDLMVSLINGNAPGTLSTLFGDVYFNPEVRSFNIPGQVALDVDNEFFQSYEQKQWPLNSAEDILGKFCPNCSGKGPICAKGNECPKECGKNNCTTSGDKTCCNSAGMPAPEY